MQTLTIILVLGFIAYKIGYIVVKAAVKDAMKEEYEIYTEFFVHLIDIEHSNKKDLTLVNNGFTFEVHM